MTVPAGMLRLRSLVLLLSRHLQAGRGASARHGSRMLPDEAQDPGAIWARGRCGFQIHRGAVVVRVAGRSAVPIERAHEALPSPDSLPDCVVYLTARGTAVRRLPNPVICWLRLL